MLTRRSRIRNVAESFEFVERKNYDAPVTLLNKIQWHLTASIRQTQEPTFTLLYIIFRRWPFVSPLWQSLSSPLRESCLKKSHDFYNWFYQIAKKKKKKRNNKKERESVNGRWQLIEAILEIEANEGRRSENRFTSGREEACFTTGRGAGRGPRAITSAGRVIALLGTHLQVPANSRDAETERHVELKRPIERASATIPPSSFAVRFTHCSLFPLTIRFLTTDTLRPPRVIMPVGSGNWVTANVAFPTFAALCKRSLVSIFHLCCAAFFQGVNYVRRC